MSHYLLKADLLNSLSLLGSSDPNSATMPSASRGAVVTTSTALSSNDSFVVDIRMSC